MTTGPGRSRRGRTGVGRRISCMSWVMRNMARLLCGETQPALLEDSRAEENVVRARGIAEHGGDCVDFRGDLVAIASMHHREQVVRPARPPRSPVAVADA